MRFLQSSWCPVFLGIIITGLIFYSLVEGNRKTLIQASHEAYRENAEWVAPDEAQIPDDSTGDLIRYGKDLIARTALYLGPSGIVARISNGMNCQNCHLDAGRQNFANPFSAARNFYPGYRPRSGRIESLEFRVNDCMKRSLNGSPLDSLSTEMRAMVAYIKWVGSEVPAGIHPMGASTQKPAFLDRAADPEKGSRVYVNYCQRCHGPNGEGTLLPNKEGYEYPPLWGPDSYNISAGLYRLSPLAGFIKNNMPFGTSWKSPQLSDEMAWDVAAFICSQPRPVKVFSEDWKNIAQKPVDYPFGPYADHFTEQQHRYGPFKEMLREKR